MSKKLDAISYPYKPKKWLMLLGILITAVASWFSILEALDERPLIIKYSIIKIPLSAFEATLLFWALTVGCVFGLIICIVGLVQALTSKAQLTITSQEISVPLGTFHGNKIITIPFKDIISWEYQHASYIRYLTIMHAKGKIHINDRTLPKKADFDEVCHLIESRIEKAHQ